MNKYLFKSKKRVYACFVDFSKAFDTVWRSAPHKKLLNLGIGGNFYKVIKYMHSNSKVAVRKDNFMSELGDYKKGVSEVMGLVLLGLQPYKWGIVINMISYQMWIGHFCNTEHYIFVLAFQCWIKLVLFPISASFFWRSNFVYFI